MNHGGSDIVRWDEAAEHMHLASVLKSRAPGGASDSGAPSAWRMQPGGTSSGAHLDAKEAAKRRAAAEKELKSIFERTYGASNKTRRADAKEADYRQKPELSEEEKARNKARSEEIKSRLEHKKGQAEQRPLAVLIDGYNLIFADEYLKELSERDMGSARDQLLDMLGNYAAYTGFEVTVIFDAYNVPYGTGHEEVVNGIRVMFTAADEPADIRMGVMTASMKDRQVYAVSSDSLVQTDVMTHGALRISSREFLSILARIEEEIRSRLK